MATKHPGLYADLGKKASDLLTKEFPDKNKIELNTRTPNGLNFIVSATRNNDGSITGLLNPKYKVAAHGVQLSLNLDTARNVKGEVTAEDLVPGLKLGLTGDGASESAKVDLEYKHEYLTVGSSFDMFNRKGNTLGFSSVLGFDGFAVGMEAKYLSSDNPRFTEVNGSAAYSGADYVATVFTRSKGDVLGATYYQRINPSVAVGTEVNFNVREPHTSPNMSVGASYDLDPFTTVKGKFNTDGKLSLSYAQRLNRYARLVLGSTINTNNLGASGNHSFGFTLALND